MDDEDADAVGAAPPPETTALVPVAGVSVQDADADKDPLLPPPPPQAPWLSAQSPALRKLFAGALILVLCMAWIALAETSQAIQAADYKKPYFLAWLAHSAYVIFLPIFVAVQYVRQRRRRHSTLRARPLALFPWRLYWRQSAVLGMLTFLVLYLWYLSLDRTRVAPNTSIYQSACVFVYGFSVYLFKEKVTLPRVAAVVICLGGVFMVAFGSTGDADGTDESALGYILLIVSTVLYAVYEVMYRYLAPNDPDNELTAPLLVLGLIGVMTACTLWIGIPIVHWAGFEVFAWPPPELAGPLALTLAMESLYNLALFGAIICTTPLFVSIGTMLTVPTAVLADWLLHSYLMTGVAWAGVALISVGYLLLNLLPV